MTTPFVQSRIISYGDYREHYITLAKPSMDKKFLENYIHTLEKKKIRIVRIVYLGNRLTLKEWSNVTKNYPTLVVGNSSGHVSSFKGMSVCVHAVEGDFKEFVYINKDKKVVGVYFISKNLEFLSLSNVSDAAKTKRKNFGVEVQSVYKKIDQVMSKFRFQQSAIYRFWNYIENISLNYRDFNLSRNRYYKKHNITQYPAATGIEASLLGSARICIGVEAMKPLKKGNITTKIVTSDMQSEAWSYGPKFSRAMRVRFPKDGVTKLYVSGTSSIDREGKSIAERNYDKNVLHVLTSVEHLLTKNNMTLECLLSSSVYCKNTKILKTFKRLYDVKKWTFPYNPVITNICRNDLLFEMECVAVKMD